MSGKKPTATIAEPIRRNCPICGKRSYSLAGTHPQCAVRQADARAEGKTLKIGAKGRKK